MKKVLITKYTLIKSLKKYYDTKLPKKANIKKLINYFNGIEIDFEGAIAELKNSKDNDKKEKERSKHSLEVNIRRVEQINDKFFFFKVDEKGNRLHTSLTNLKKTSRKYVTYNGQKLMAWDICNSQLFLGTRILDKEFYKEKGGNKINYKILPKEIKDRIDRKRIDKYNTIMIGKNEVSLDWHGSPDVNLFISHSTAGSMFYI